jgi:hypothetical protein
MMIMIAVVDECEIYSEDNEGIPFPFLDDNIKVLQHFIEREEEEKRKSEGGRAREGKKFR